LEGVAVRGLIVVGLMFVLAGACDAGGGATGSTGSSSGASGPGSGSGGAGGLDFVGSGGSDTCPGTCSTDFHSVLTCDGTVVQTCEGTQGCDPSTLTCRDACE